uniref:Retinol dehydrogenase 13 n=1 Tax=Clastoptera arizonana TaxID=38151 RepID=A0A1B6EAX4_9HEMI
MGITGGKYVGTTRLDGKTAIITGCNTGIGKITAKEFYRIGARVIMACRDINKTEDAAKEIKETVLPSDDSKVGEVIIHKLDLSSLASVRECAKKILDTEPNIHLLINNAGVMACPKSTTDDGFEMQFGVNHLGHFLFTSLLLPRIIKSSPARIINVSSRAHERGRIDFNDLNWEKKSYSPLGAYSQSKLANVLFTVELNKRLRENGITGVNTYALHPGVVETELGRNLDSAYFNGARWITSKVIYFILKTPEQGAQTTLYCALDKAVENETGLYYSDCKIKSPSRAARDEESAKRLWEESMTLVGMANSDPFQDLNKK